MLLTCVPTCPSPRRPVHSSIRTYVCSDPVRGSLGALRLKVRLLEDRVLPSRCYRPLLELLMESVLQPAEVGASDKHALGGWGGAGGGSGPWPPCFRETCLSCSGVPGPGQLACRLSFQEDVSSPLAVLEELTSGDCRQDLATKLAKLFLGQGLAGPFLDYLTRRELARTSELPTGPRTARPQG